jgi:hypothetical protein
VPVTGDSAAHAIPLPSKNAAVPIAKDFFQVIIFDSPLWRNFYLL